MRVPGFLIVLLAIPLLCACQAQSPPPSLDNVPLVWRPTDDIRLAPQNQLAGITRTRIAVETLRDKRVDRRMIGRNVESPNRILPVTTSGDVSAFVTDHLARQLFESGLTVVRTNAEVRLRGEIDTFFVEESSRYRGDLRVRLTLVNERGMVLWQGIGGGGAQRSGRSYKLEDYYEVLSDSIVRTAYNLIATPAFRNVLRRVHGRSA